jgi:hypothetical protein
MRLMGTDDSALYLGKSERHSLFSDLRAGSRIVEGCQVRDLETIDSELRLAAALRCAARERGGPLPSIDVADVLLDERKRSK